ncbi:LuxR C-terminal-related transcriptional regulator [Nonomuraea sp. NPDC000554]|uniref:ATP-binding protein n=1 Tax=Nonomuraea sp. NPDC000554 TaxID=3154259 RepID=UPI003318829C
MTSQTSRRPHLSQLPADVTSFVGRRHEVAEAKRLLSHSRIVTFTGPGGVGKTRLGLRVAAEVSRAFPNGVRLVELAALNDPGMLGQTVAESLEVRDWSSRPPLDVLADHLKDKRMLLVLDNCEHLLHACTVLVETLTRAAPELRVLATSRQVLGVSGEQVLAVPAMNLPDRDDSPLPPQSLMRYDAVRLFAERVAAVLPGFAVTEDNQQTVERICRRLDGIPLAIELAAVRLRMLSLTELLDRLDERFQLLTAGSRAVLPRHRTLRALIDWSYELCTEQERLLWARVAVFAGGLDLEAAEEVCSGDGIARGEVLDLVIGLVDKSILITDEQTPSMRYRLLDTIQHYGRERLKDSGQESAMRHRHREYYRHLAARAVVGRFGADQATCFTSLHRDHSNMRTALDHCFATGDTGTGLEMATDLAYHWITSYYMKEGQRWLELGLAAETEPSERRAMALWAAGWLAIIQGELDTAEKMLAESRDLGERLGLERVLAYVAIFWGGIILYRGDTDKAIANYQEAAARSQAIGDPLGQSLAHLRLCLAYSLTGDSSAAIENGERCLAVSDAYGESWHRARGELALGLEYWRQGDLAQAVELEEGSLRYNRSVDDLLGVGMNLEVLSWIAATEKRFQRAGRLLGAIQVIWGEMGTPMASFAYLMRYHDACESSVRAALGESAFQSALKQGARLSIDEAIVLALEEEAPQEPAEPSGEPSPLTARETEIAQLVAQGMSNKEIAATLVIAQRTAEGHIEHILSKLGFTSRAQIAVWIGERNQAAGKPDAATP